jgi:hypothetical protein
VAQQIFSRLPGGHRLNYAFQRHVTRNLPITDDALRVIDIVSAHVRGLQDRSMISIESAQFFEFGAGRDLHVAQVRISTRWISPRGSTRTAPQTCSSRVASRLDQVADALDAAFAALPRKRDPNGGTPAESLVTAYRAGKRRRSVFE